MIRIEQLSKSFRKVQALIKLSASFDTGQSIAVIGPNGSGKTTLIKCILGMVRPSSGKIFFRDQEIIGSRDYLQEVGYMPQIGRYPDRMKVGEVFELLKTIRRNKDNPRLEERLIEAFDLQDIFHQQMYTLSGGTRQKVSASLAFLFSPSVLMLDEPTAGLDPISAELLREHILKSREEDKLILISSHIHSDLDSICTHILFLNEGEVLFYKPIAELKRETGELQLSKAVAKIMKNELIQ